MPGIGRYARDLRDNFTITQGRSRIRFADNVNATCADWADWADGIPTNVWVDRNPPDCLSASCAVAVFGSPASHALRISHVPHSCGVTVWPPETIHANQNRPARRCAEAGFLMPFGKECPPLVRNRMASIPRIMPRCMRNREVIR
jgi:hypothetical protein